MHRGRCFGVCGGFQFVDCVCFFFVWSDAVCDIVCLRHIVSFWYNFDFCLLVRYPSFSSLESTEYSFRV